MSTTQNNIHHQNRLMALGVAAIVFGLIAFSIFAVPPAYRLFCQVTGWGGTPQRVDVAGTIILDRKITIRFDSNIDPALPWRFKPAQPNQTLQVGETSLAYYESENLTNNPVTGHATFNVSPAKAGRYFKKIDCFCFTEQTLQPGQKVSMPVAYFIDPAIDKDRSLDEVETITLSYTFFRLDQEGDIVITDNSGT